MEVINDSRLPEQPHRKGETNIAGNIYLGIILVAIGVIWLFYNTGWIGYGLFNALFSWQMLLVAAGGYLLAVRRWSAGVIIGNTSIDIDSLVGDLQTSLEAMSLGGLIGLWFQSLFVGLTMNILSICIMLVVYGRMIEIYLVTSLGPIPLATMTNGEWHNVGQNYLKSLLALGFQAFLIMVVVGIYSVLIQSISATGDVSGAIWLAMGYTVLLCFCLFKTSSMAKAVFSAH